jgi:hypothetical protein
MDCEAARAQLADRLTGDLLPDASAALDEHLRSCASCAAEARTAADTWQLLGEIPAVEADSAAMRARFDDMLDASTPPSGFLRGPHAAALVRRSPQGEGGWLGHALQAAAAVILVAGGFFVGRQTVPAPTVDPAISELREELRATRQMVSLSLLQQQSASERLRGITYTSQIDRPGGELVGALIDTLLHDPDVNVRLKTIEALKRFADRSNVRRAAVDALTEPASSPLVQIELIDFLVDANERSAAPSMRRLADDTMADKAVRAHAAWGLQQIG